MLGDGNVCKRREPSSSARHFDGHPVAGCHEQRELVAPERPDRLRAGGTAAADQDERPDDEVLGRREHSREARGRGGGAVGTAPEGAPRRAACRRARRCCTCDGSNRCKRPDHHRADATPQCPSRPRSAVSTDEAVAASHGGVSEAESAVSAGPLPPRCGWPDDAITRDVRVGGIVVRRVGRRTSAGKERAGVMVVLALAASEPSPPGPSAGSARAGRRARREAGRPGPPRRSTRAEPRAAPRHPRQSARARRATPTWHRPTSAADEARTHHSVARTALPPTPKFARNADPAQCHHRPPVNAHRTNSTSDEHPTRCP